MNDIERLKEDLVEYSHRCYQRNLICATGGNISIRIPGKNEMLIKGSGSAFSELTVEDIVRVDLDGNHIEGKAKASKEWRFHAGIYKAREDIGAVVHVHPPYATAVANTMDHLPLITNHAKGYLKNVPTIGIASSGSEELGSIAVEPFRDENTPAILMREHGIISTSDCVRKAFFLAEMIEDTAQIFLLSKLNAGE